MYIMWISCVECCNIYLNRLSEVGLIPESYGCNNCAQLSVTVRDVIVYSCTRLSSRCSPKRWFEYRQSCSHIKYIKSIGSRGCGWYLATVYTLNELSLSRHIHPLGIQGSRPTLPFTVGCLAARAHDHSIRPRHT